MPHRTPLLTHLALRALVVAAALSACAGPELPTAATPLASAPSRALEQANHLALAGVANPALAVVPASVTITQGRGMPFRALNTDPLSAKQATAPITWSSSNPAVATVSSTGFVRGVAPGSVTITASAINGQFVATSALTIAPRPNCTNPAPLPTSISGVLAPLPSTYEDTPYVFRLTVAADPDPCHKYTVRVLELPVSGTLYQVAEDGSIRDGAVPLGGTVTNSEGWVAYVSNKIPGFYGIDTFRYNVIDPAGGIYRFLNPIPFEILPVNDPPVAIPVVHHGDNSVAINNVLLQATDVDNLSNQVDVCIAKVPQNGDLYWQSVLPANRVVAGDCRPFRSLRYVSRIDNPTVCGAKPPKSAYPLGDSFRWYATDGSAASDTVTNTISIAYANRSPEYTGPATVSTLEDTPVTFTLNGGDVDGDVLAVTLFAPPKHGVLLRSDGSQVLNYPALFLAPTTLTYVPAADFNTLTQTDDMTFELSDAYANPCPSKVRFSVAPVNDAPTVLAPDRIGAIVALGGVGQPTGFSMSVADDARPTDVLAVTLRGQGPAAARIDLTNPTGFEVRRVSPLELRFEGTLAAINTLLGRGVQWTPNASGAVYGELAVIVDDRGNYGPGGPMIGTKIVAVDVGFETEGGLEPMRASARGRTVSKRPPAPDRR